MEWLGAGLNIDAHARREHQVLDVAELVHARAEREAELLEEELLLEVGAELGRFSAWGAT